MNSVQFFIRPMVPGPQAEESTFLRDRRPKASLQVEASAHAYARSGAQLVGDCGGTNMYQEKDPISPISHQNQCLGYIRYPTFVMLRRFCWVEYTIHWKLVFQTMNIWMTGHRSSRIPEVQNSIEILEFSQMNPVYDKKTVCSNLATMLSSVRSNRPFKHLSEIQSQLLSPHVSCHGQKMLFYQYWLVIKQIPHPPWGSN